MFVDVFIDTLVWVKQRNKCLACDRMREFKIIWQFTE